MGSLNVIAMETSFRTPVAPSAGVTDTTVGATVSGGGASEASPPASLLSVPAAPAVPADPAEPSDPDEPAVPPDPAAPPDGLPTDPPDPPGEDPLAPPG